MTVTLKSVALAAGLALSLPSMAHESFYAAQLLGSSEVPAAVTTGFGTAFVTVDFDLVTMRVQASFEGLTGNTTASHIHCCVNPGTNVGVATTTPTFVGFPLGVKAGTFDQTYDMSAASSYNAAFITNNGGTVSTAFNALVAGLDAGRAYLNVHTTTFSGGEIRALLLPVPEPESYALMLTGLAGVLTIARRKKQA